MLKLTTGSISNCFTLTTASGQFESLQGVRMRLFSLYKIQHLNNFDMHHDSTNNLTYEPRNEKTGFLHMRKQRRRSASR